MENNLDCVKHSGIIESIEENIIYVKILSMTGCASCDVKGMCNTAEMEEKSIEVIHDKKEHQIGEHVTIIMDKKLGPKAVLLGYFYPFLILLLSLIIMLAITDNEGLSALVGLGMVIPYYALIYFFKDRLKKKFTFRLG